MKYCYPKIAVAVLSTASVFVQVSNKIETNKSTLFDAVKAIRRDDVTTLKSMFDKGLRLDVSLPGGYTLLHQAASKRSTKCIKFLIDHGCPINARTDYSGFTAIHFSALVGDVVNAKVLIAAKATLDRKSDDGTTALDIAKVKGFKELVTVLEKAAKK